MDKKIHNKLLSLRDNSIWIFTKQSMNFDEAFNATRLFSDIDKGDNIEECFYNNYKNYNLSTDRHRILIIAQLFGLLSKNRYYSSGDRYKGAEVTEIFNLLRRYPIGSNEYNIIKTEQILKIKVKAIINARNQNDTYHLLPVIFSFNVLKRLKEKYGIESVSVGKFMTYVMTASDYSEIDNVVELLRVSKENDIYKNIVKYKENSRFLTILRNNINLFIINEEDIKINPIYENYFSIEYLNKINILTLHKQITNDNFYRSFLTTYQDFNVNLIDVPAKMNGSNINLDVYGEDLIADTDYVNTVNQQEEIDELELINSHKNKPNIRENVLSKYDRNPLIGKIAIIQSGYKCINNSMHSTFLSKTTNKQFMEAHHLIPISFQSEFWEKNNINIDCVENIVALCPNCHRAIHYSIDSYRKEILKNLYTQKIKELKKIGIDISFEELLDYYKI